MMYMWWTKTPHFPFGAREVRWLLVARGMGGFFGVFGMYCSYHSFLTLFQLLSPRSISLSASFPLVNIRASLLPHTYKRNHKNRLPTLPPHGRRNRDNLSRALPLLLGLLFPHQRTFHPNRENRLTGRFRRRNLHRTTYLSIRRWRTCDSPRWPRRRHGSWCFCPQWHHNGTYTGCVKLRQCDTGPTTERCRTGVSWGMRECVCVYDYKMDRQAGAPFDQRELLCRMVHDCEHDCAADTSGGGRVLVACGCEGVGIVDFSWGLRIHYGEFDFLS